MLRYTQNIEKAAVSRGLHCVWVPVHEGNRDRLISIWIDPAMRAFESQCEPHTGSPAEEHALAADGDAPPAEETGDPCRRLAA